MAQRRRPKTENPKKRRIIGMTDEDWEYCLKQPGGASEFINQLVHDHRAIQTGEMELRLKHAEQSNETE